MVRESMGQSKNAAPPCAQRQLTRQLLVCSAAKQIMQLKVVSV